MNTTKLYGLENFGHRNAAGETRAEARGAVGITLEKRLRRIRFGIDLPKAAAEKAASLVLDKAPYVMRGVAEEEANLMGKACAHLDTLP